MPLLNNPGIALGALRVRSSAMGGGPTNAVPASPCSKEGRTGTWSYTACRLDSETGYCYCSDVECPMACDGDVWKQSGTCTATEPRLEPGMCGELGTTERA